MLVLVLVVVMVVLTTGRFGRFGRGEHDRSLCAKWTKPK